MHNETKINHKFDDEKFIESTKIGFNYQSVKIHCIIWPIMEAGKAWTELLSSKCYEKMEYRENSRSKHDQTMKEWNKSWFENYDLFRFVDPDNTKTIIDTQQISQHNNKKNQNNKFNYPFMNQKNVFLVDGCWQLWQTHQQQILMLSFFVFIILTLGDTPLEQ